MIGQLNDHEQRKPAESVMRRRWAHYSVSTLVAPYVEAELENTGVRTLVDRNPCVAAQTRRSEREVRGRSRRAQHPGSGQCVQHEGIHQNEAFESGDSTRRPAKARALNELTAFHTRERYPESPEQPSTDAERERTRAHLQSLGRGAQR